MPSQQPERFAAESGHERPAVAGLAGILDRYDEHRAALEAESPAEVVTREEREQFALDYSSFREHGLRAALEEVAWQLEQRGHHAWIEDVGAQDVPAVIDARREHEATPRSLLFRILPAHSELDRTAAPRLGFVPDVEECRVQVEATFGDPRDVAPVAVSVPLRVERLTERLLIEMTADFVRQVLLGDERPEPPAGRGDGFEVTPRDRAFDGSLSPSPAPEAVTPPAEVDHEWSDSGITKRWLQQQSETDDGALT